MRACSAQVQSSRWLGRASALLALLATTGALASPVIAAPPASVPVSAAGSIGAANAARTPLPSYFTVELGMSGALSADGRELASPAELERVARDAAARGSFAGAVLFGDPRSGSTLEAVADVLRRAGFATLVEARRSAPPVLSALARAERERARRAKERLVAAGVIEGDAPPRSSAAPAAERGSRVELQSAGLYLAGPANTEPARRNLVKLFERNFGAFRRCHSSAPEHTDNASFGVDLLVPKEGGRAKVRETRTRLAGSSFKTCMARAFEAIRFEPPVTARPEIVSYSVLFKPQR
ncbi:MAG: hypothetical protein RL033_5699 [Pseudomonadota bacterium]